VDGKKITHARTKASPIADFVWESATRAGILASIALNL